MPDGQRVSTLLAAMGLKVYRLLHDPLSTTVPGIATYIIIIAAMQVHYSPISLMITEQYWFHQRHWGSGQLAAVHCYSKEDVRTLSLQANLK